jgi:hypothetical protein
MNSLVLVHETRAIITVKRSGIRAGFSQRATLGAGIPSEGERAVRPQRHGEEPLTVPSLPLGGRWQRAPGPAWRAGAGSSSSRKVVLRSGAATSSFKRP